MFSVDDRTVETAPFVKSPKTSERVGQRRKQSGGEKGGAEQAEAREGKGGRQEGQDADERDLSIESDVET